MQNETVGRVLITAAREGVFRRAMLEDMGCALAAEGFVLSDDEMRALREKWDTLRGLSERTAQERIRAWAWSYTREKDDRKEEKRT